jgi:mono/diheme cytochrome c family protein
MKMRRIFLLATAAASLAWSSDDVAEAGKKVFDERCSSCHAERGDKPLDTGLPLNQRSLTDAQLNRAVAGRLKSSPPEERRAVALYIRSLLKK